MNRRNFIKCIIAGSAFVPFIKIAANSERVVPLVKSYIGDVDHTSFPMTATEVLFRQKEFDSRLVSELTELNLPFINQYQREVMKAYSKKLDSRVFRKLTS